MSSERTEIEASSLADHFLCPIMQEMMHEPVTASDGYTYERQAITSWIEQRGARAISPLTGERLAHHELQPNYLVKKMIEEYKAKAPLRKQKELTQKDIELAMKLRQEELDRFLQKQALQLKTLSQEHDHVKAQMGPLAQENARLKEEISRLNSDYSQKTNKRKREDQSSPSLASLQNVVEDTVFTDHLHEITAIQQKTETLTKAHAANIIKRSIASHITHKLLRKTDLQKRAGELSHQVEIAQQQLSHQIKAAEQEVNQKIQVEKNGYDQQINVLKQAINQANEANDDESIAGLANQRKNIIKEHQEKVEALKKTLSEKIIVYKKESLQHMNKVKAELQQIKQAQSGKRDELSKRAAKIAFWTESIEKQKKLLIENAIEQQEKAQIFFLQLNQKADLTVKKLNKQKVEQVNPEKDAALLKWVAEGHLEEVEKLLQQNPQLAFVKSTVKDLSDRTFENITAFQLAVWYLDTEMWEIILKYLDKTQAALQLNELENDRKDIHQKYGKTFDFDPLLEAYQTYIDNYAKWNDNQRVEHWCQKVGGEQRKVPAWFIYAFCEVGEDKAWPRADFTQEVKREYGEGHTTMWHTAKYSEGVVGDKFAVSRGAGEIGCYWARCELLSRFHIRYGGSRGRPLGLVASSDFANSQLLKSSHQEQLAKLQASLRGLQNVGKPLDNTEKVAALLKWVTEGHLEEAEKLLQKNPQLALAQGTVKDLSDRTFENITAFQLAVWYLDSEMWEIILKYLDKTQAALQLQALENDRKDIHQKYGKTFDFDPLLEAYQTYIDNYAKWNDNQREEQWCKKVGGEQRKVPAWFIYAFCEVGEDKAWPRADFTKKVKRQYVHSFSHTAWWMDHTSLGVRGDKFGIWRSAWAAHACYLAPPAFSTARYDCANSKILKSSHKEQLEILQVSLESLQNVGKPKGVGLKK